MESEPNFDWQRQAAAERLCLDLLAEVQRQSPTLAELAAQLRQQASGRLLDWVDHLLLELSPTVRQGLSAAGFVRHPHSEEEVFHHPGAVLPRLLPTPPGNGAPGVALRVESLADFLQRHAFRADIEGEPFAPYRRARLPAEGGVTLLAVERRGSRGFAPLPAPPDYQHAYLAGVELWQSRPRAIDDEAAALAEARRRAQTLVARLGTDLAAHLVCQEERRYWLARNFAGRLQHGRQAALGLGWGNHDHYTFRSSRRHFPQLVELFCGLGFHLRERFYAGAEAGWGAQLMENPAAGLTLFLDVDLAPEEVATDFAREPLPPRQELGTVGLWCALHGDSILGSGLHHLAAQFDFNRLTEDLGRHGVACLPPFSDFPYLHQAFTVAERWPVEPQRLQRLVGEGAISAEQGEIFHARGAIGSHLENIERREGYKGFNKKNVSLIIRRTDPRGEGEGQF